MGQKNVYQKVALFPESREHCLPAQINPCGIAASDKSATLFSLSVPLIDLDAL
jgi:hypothetical protein